MSGDRLIKVIKQCVAEAMPKNSLSDVISGEVISIAPLQIKIDNRFTVDARFLILSPFCRPLKFEETVIWRGLDVGDYVNLLRCSGGQKYYVLDGGAQ